MSKPLLVTIPHALQIVQVGRTKLYEMIGDGRVKAVKVDNRTLIVYSSLEALAECSEPANANTPPAA
jgi:hypothetical protein